MACSLPASAVRGLLLAVRAAQRLAGAVDHLADEAVLRVDQPVGHLHRGVDDLLALRRSLALRGERLVNGIDKLTNRVDRGPLTLLNGLEHLFGQFRRPDDRTRGTSRGRATLAGRRGFAAALRLVVVCAIVSSVRDVDSFSVPSLSTSGETLTIEESMPLRARTENAGDVGDEHEWSWSRSRG
jgi:hypothetical protein